MLVIYICSTTSCVHTYSMYNCSHHSGIGLRKAGWCVDWHCCSSSRTIQYLSQNVSVEARGGGWHRDAPTAKNVQTRSVLMEHKWWFWQLCWFWFLILIFLKHNIADSDSHVAPCLENILSYLILSSPSLSFPLDHLASEALLGKANLPHLGKALTDVQELKQATWPCHPTFNVAINKLRKHPKKWDECSRNSIRD